MNLSDEKSFEDACGKMMPLRRNMATFNGDSFNCACVHIFDSNITQVISEGFRGVYQDLEYLAGHKINTIEP